MSRSDLGRAIIREQVRRGRKDIWDRGPEWILMNALATEIMSDRIDRLLHHVLDLIRGERHELEERIRQLEWRLKQRGLRHP